MMTSGHAMSSPTPHAMSGHMMASPKASPNHTSGSMMTTHASPSPPARPELSRTAARVLEGGVKAGLP
jgi:hypothetical protein